MLLILGDTDSRVLTRELLYTGATRAKQSVVLVGTESIVRATVGRRSHRISGLTDALRRPATRATVMLPEPVEPPPATESEEPDDGTGEQDDGPGRQMSLFG